MACYPKGKFSPLIIFSTAVLLFPCSLHASIAPAGSFSEKGLMNKIMSISIKDDEAEDVQYGTTISIIGNGKIPDYLTQSIDFPPRIIIDFITDTASFQSIEIPAKSRNLEKVRIGHHPKKIRLVLVLKTAHLPTLKTRVAEKTLTIILRSQNRMNEGEGSPKEVSLVGEKDDILLKEIGALEFHDPKSAETPTSEQEPTRFEPEDRESSPDVMKNTDYNLVLTRNVQDDRKKDTTLFLKGMTAYRNQEWSKAMKAFGRLIEKYPKGRYTEKAFFLLAKSYASLYSDEPREHFSQIKSHFESALYQFPMSKYSSVALLGIGNLFFGIERYDEALGYYNLVFKRDGESIQAYEALMKKNEILIMKKKFKEALSISEYLIRSYPVPPESIGAHVEKARILLEMNDFHHSLKILSELDPIRAENRYQYPEISLYAGLNYYQLGNAALARENLFRFYNIRPDDRVSPLILTKIADTYREDGFMDHAVKIYTLVLERHPHSEGALISLIRVAELQEAGKLEINNRPEFNDKLIVKKFGLPKELYEEVITTLLEKDEDNPLIQLAQLKLGILYRKDADYRKSFDTLKKVLEKYPGTSLKREVYQALTETLRAMMTEEMELKDYVNVVNLYVREYQLLSLLESPDLFLTVGRASIHLDLDDLAIETFTNAERLMADKEKPTDLLFNLAKHHFMMNELDEAMARLELIPEPPSDDKYAPDVFELKGRILLEQKEYKQAAEMFSSALKYDLKPCVEMNFLLEKAKALTASDIKKNALLEIKKADDLKGECALKNPGVFQEIGNLYLQLGEPKRALSLFTQALQIGAGEENKIRLRLKIAQCYRALNKQEDSLALYDEILAMDDPFWSQFAKEKVEEIKFNAAIKNMEKEDERGDHISR